MSVATARDCTWSIAADAAWIALSAAQNGQGTTTVGFSVAPNPAPAARSAGIVVGGDRQTITQAGAPCRYDLSRSGDSVPSAGGSLTVVVTTLTGCSWTATSAATWIAITGGASGNASGTVTMSVAANTGAARVGQVNAAGQTYTVSQEGVAASGGGGGGGGGGGTSPVVVHLSGTVSDLSGSCPNLQFSLADLRVSTSAATTFSGGSCKDVKKKTAVNVTGTKNGSDVDAQVVTIVSSHD